MVTSILSFHKASLQVEIDRFSKFAAERQDNITTFTKSAFSQARQKLKPSAFIALRNEQLQYFDAQAPHKKNWKSFRVIAIDGSSLNLPPSPCLSAHFGVFKNQNTTASVGAKVSIAYDVCNQLILDATISSIKDNEHDLARQHLGQLQPYQDLLLFDRGYPSISFAKSVTSKAFSIVPLLNSSKYLSNSNKNFIAISFFLNATDLNIISGQSVHRNEFGINGGIFFSPNGNQIAFYTMDQTMVEDYPIVNWSKTPAVVENIKYPMAGRTSHQVKLGVYNIQSQKTTYLNIAGPKDQYLTSVTWSPDEKYIYVGVLNRNQKHLTLNQYNANTGQFVKTLFEEKSDTYVEPQHPLYFINNNEFVWWSQRDGYMHLYRYNTDGKLLNQITKGDWLVNGIYKIDASNKNIYFSATKADAREKHTYVVNYTNGKITALDQEAGMHTALFNDQNYFVDIFQNAEQPRTINIKNASGKQVRPLLKAENKLAKYDQANVEMVTLQAEDGTPLYGKLITPADMDPNKKYPVIVYLYNGPHLQLITNGYPATGNLWYDYLAQNGYVVFTMDGRGSSNRGHKFESATYEQLGQVEMKDQLVGVDYLKTLPFVDASRMGVHGWSYGGFMTTSLMTQYPEVFKVGVAGGPVIDWNMYEIMYTERYMNHPEQNPEGYKQTNLLDKSDKLQGKLLMIHGADDDVVIWQHSLNFIENAVKAGKQVDYYVYPGHKHNVIGKDRVHLMQKITDYFDANLK